MMDWLDRFWHRTLGRPYRLARTVEAGAGPPVILLHGLGRSGQVWQYVVKLLEPLGTRIVAFDLLGFGDSPKPRWLRYDIDDHAQTVIDNIKALHLGEPAVLVGHSMGCLVVVRVARLRPDLVRHLVLYEMPLYEGLPQKRRYRLRTDLYFRFFKKITEYHPEFNEANRKLSEKLARRVVGLEVTPETWLPFIRSLENTIMKQTTAQDILSIAIPMDVIYGSFDMLVIRGKPQQFFGDKAETITAHTVRARHSISLKASHLIVARVRSALDFADEVTEQQVREAIGD
jgi:pimeloyl-ACP methyl ester carboxylesterase